MSRNINAAIAADTLNILEQGFFLNARGQKILISPDLAASRLYTPEQLDAMLSNLQTGSSFQTRIEVTGETSLEAAQRLNQNSQPWLCLNFASAKNAGGGFMGGAQAQEESLARSSALYPTLIAHPQYYQFHRTHRSLLYSDHMIYSPAVPVFKNDSGELLLQSYPLSFITSPAPNFGAMGQSGDVQKVPAVLENRSAKILALALHHGYRNLILGAWGCGVFRNDPTQVAQTFKKHLGQGGRFEGRFEHIVFAVFDRSKEQATFKAFQKELS